MSPTLIGLVDSEDMEQVYEGIQAQYHRTHTTGHSHKLRQMLKGTADKRGDVTQEEAAIGSVDSEDVVEAYKATPGSSTDEWLRTNGANPNQNREALRGMMAKQAVKASSKWGSKNKMLQVKFAKEVKAAEKELVVEARASGWSQKMLNMKVAEAKEEIRAEIENETATLDQTVDKEAINQAFDRLDSNHDGVLARDEFCEGVETAHKAAAAEHAANPRTDLSLGYSHETLAGDAALETYLEAQLYPLLCGSDALLPCLPDLELLLPGRDSRRIRTRSAIGQGRPDKEACRCFQGSNEQSEGKRQAKTTQG